MASRILRKSMIPKRHVFLIHGTWAYKDEAQLKAKPWYSTESDFAASFRKKLDEIPTEPAHWEFHTFPWPHCDNKHADRVKAAQELAQRIKELRRSHPDGTIHFVAHSHGGNVMLEALSIWFRESATKSSNPFSKSYKTMRIGGGKGRSNQRRDRRKSAPSSKRPFTVRACPRTLHQT
jgi:hypothetical protein